MLKKLLVMLLMVTMIMPMAAMTAWAEVTPVTENFSDNTNWPVANFSESKATAGRPWRFNLGTGFSIDDTTSGWGSKALRFNTTSNAGLNTWLWWLFPNAVDTQYVDVSFRIKSNSVAGNKDSYINIESGTRVTDSTHGYIINPRKIFAVLKYNNTINGGAWSVEDGNGVGQHAQVLPTVTDSYIKFSIDFTSKTFFVTVSATSDFANETTTGPYNFKSGTTDANNVAAIHIAQAQYTNGTIDAFFDDFIIKEGSAPSVAIAGVAVDPVYARAQKNGTKLFNATVSGTGSYDDSVTWTVEGSTNSETKMIEPAGTLQVAADETAETLTVRATSVGDNTKSGTAAVYVTTPSVDGLIYREDFNWVGLAFPYNLITGTKIEGWTFTGSGLSIVEPGAGKKALQVTGYYNDASSAVYSFGEKIDEKKLDVSFWYSSSGYVGPHDNAGARISLRSDDGNEITQLYFGSGHEEDKSIEGFGIFMPDGSVEKLAEMGTFGYIKLCLDFEKEEIDVYLCADETFEGAEKKATIPFRNELTSGSGLKELIFARNAYRQATNIRYSDIKIARTPESGDEQIDVINITSAIAVGNTVTVILNLLEGEGVVASGFSGKLILALYTDADNKELVDVKVCDISEDNFGDMPETQIPISGLTIPAGADGTGMYAKAYLIKDYTNIKPLCKNRNIAVSVES